VVSSALDSAVGIATGLRAAAALPTLDHACGLGTGSLFVEDVAAPVEPVDGCLPVTPATPDPARLAGRGGFRNLGAPDRAPLVVSFRPLAIIPSGLTWIAPPARPLGRPVRSAAGRSGLAGMIRPCGRQLKPIRKTTMETISPRGPARGTSRRW